MTIFKKRQKPTTHIVKKEVPASSPLHTAVTGGAQGTTRDWGIKRDEFRIDSPPGRF